MLSSIKLTPWGVRPRWDWLTAGGTGHRRINSPVAGCQTLERLTHCMGYRTSANQFPRGRVSDSGEIDSLHVVQDISKSISPWPGVRLRRDWLNAWGTEHQRINSPVAGCQTLERLTSQNIRPKGSDLIWGLIPRGVRFFNLKIIINKQILNQNQKYFSLLVRGQGGFDYEKK